MRIMVQAQSGAADPSERPLPESYWVEPGRLLVGEYPGSASRAAAMDRVSRFMRAGITCFVDLTVPGELPPYEPLLPATAPGGRAVAYRREPIPDHGVPASREAMRLVIATIDDALAEGHVVYLHCRAGIGRSALVAGCWLAARRGSTVRAIEELRSSWRQSARSSDWPTVPETLDQLAFLEGFNGGAEAPRAAPVVIEGRAARLRGAFLGLAAGDAAGDARERGIANTGRWGQHTALALCLAESLAECGGFDARDQIERYVRWLREGHLSADGRPGEPTPDVTRALATYQWRGLAMAGSHDPRDRGTSSLPRVLAAVASAGTDPGVAVQLAAESSRTTHQSPVVLEACRYWGALVFGALAGADFDALCADPYEPVTGFWAARPIRPAVLAQLRGKRRPPAQSPRAVDAVEAVRRARAAATESTDVDGAIARAIETAVEPALEAALAGTLAGAVHGSAGLGAGTLARLARTDLIDRACAGLGSPSPGPGASP